MCVACGSCEKCPLDDQDCVAVYEEEFDAMDLNRIEWVVSDWAKEHPEPHYPTWRDWLETQYMQTRKALECGYEPLNSWMNKTPIPADIAEKLGIEPKEERE